MVRLLPVSRQTCKGSYNTSKTVNLAEQRAGIGRSSESHPADWFCSTSR
jgi:hypothetical protein